LVSNLISKQRRFKTGVPYGLLEGMKDIQRDCNVRVTKSVYAINSARLIFEGNPLPGQSIEKIQEQLKRIDSVVMLPKDSKFQYSSNAQLGEEQLKIIELYLKLIQRVTGIHDEMLGIQTNATSGLSQNIRQVNSVRNNVFAFDSFSQMKKRETRFILNIIQSSGQQNLAVEVLSPPEKQTVILNAAVSSIFVMIIRNFLMETEDFRRFTKKVSTIPVESYFKRLSQKCLSNKKNGIIFLVLSMGYPVLFTFNFTFFSPLIIKQLGYEKDFIYLHNFWIVSAHLFFAYLMAYVPSKLGWHKYRTMAVYHIIAAIGVAALIYGSLTQDWPIWIYIVIQTITMLGITWNLIYGYILKKFPIEDRFKLMAAYGGSARILSYIFFIIIFPSVFNCNDVLHYGILCIVMIVASMYAAYEFTKTNT
jgi:hypothetical protein